MPWLTRKEARRFYELKEKLNTNGPCDLQTPEAEEYNGLFEKIMNYVTSW